MYDEKPKKEMLFVFSAKAAEKHGNHMALDENGKLFAYTASYRQDGMQDQRKYSDWGDEQGVKTMFLPVDQDVQQVVEHGELINQDKYEDWIPRPDFS